MKQKIKWIASLRGISCLIVLFSHIISTNSRIGIYASGCGKIGVWFFMLISGMLSVFPYIDNQDSAFCIKDIPRFYVKKALKIYPYYVFALLLAFVLGFYPPKVILSHLFLMEGWGHFWFMPVIIKFYFICPFFILILCYLNRYLSKYSHLIFTILIVITGLIFVFYFRTHPISKIQYH